MLPAPSQTQHSLCRSVSGDVVRQLRRSESERVRERVREKSRAESQGCYSVLFVAATHCYRVVAAWRWSSLLFLSLFLSRTCSSSHSFAQSLALCLIRTVCAPHFCSSLLASWLARHHQNIDILNVLQQLALEINHSCKSKPCLDFAPHGLYTKDKFIVCNVRLDKIDISKGDLGFAALPCSIAETIFVVWLFKLFVTWVIFIIYISWVTCLNLLVSNDLVPSIPKLDGLLIRIRFCLILVFIIMYLACLKEKVMMIVEEIITLLWNWEGLSFVLQFRC